MKSERLLSASDTVVLDNSKPTKNKMAGKFCVMRALGAFSLPLPLPPPLYKPYPPSRFPSSTLAIHKHPKLSVMAQPQPESHTTNGSSEPSSKIPKLHPNDDVSSTPPFLRVKKLSDKAVLPSRASPLSAGYDLSSAVETKVPARGKALVATDISIAITEGTYARVAPRSGLAWKHSIDVGAGVIDADYRGPVGVILFNHSDVDFEVKIGDRVAQLIIEKIVTPSVTEVEDLDETVRGEGGFGSTGV